jgi:hypothetical protein
LSNALPRLVWVLVAIGVLIALMRVATTRSHHSNDQKILIEKSKQRN